MAKPKTTKKVIQKAVKIERTVRCSDCPLKAGLKDDYNLCSTCEGTGQVTQKKG